MEDLLNGSPQPGARDEEFTYTSAPFSGLNLGGRGR